MTNSANKLPIIAALPSENLEEFLVRCASEFRWPASQRDHDLVLLRGVFTEALAEDEQLQVAGHVLRALSFTADPTMALGHLARYLAAQGQSGRDELLSLQANSEQLHLLASLFSFSDYLSNVVIHRPDFLPAVMRSHGLSRPKSLDAYRKDLSAFLEGTDPAQHRACLVGFKMRELLRIGVREVSELGTVGQLCGELSNLAEVITEEALRHTMAAAIARHGAPHSERDGAPVEFTILAMGKFGAGELNFSSDVDLIYLYTEEGETTGVPDPTTGRPMRRLTNHEFFEKVGRDLSKYISEAGADGFLYRVDLRLRPDGATGPLARSLPAFVNYLHSQASIWEKVAYLKARPIGGNNALAHDVMTQLTPFVYQGNDRKELVEEIAHLKHRIDFARLDAQGRENDIKRGFGGIREIEFLVAALQMLGGDADPALRVRGTLPALQVLIDRGLILPGDGDRLRRGYNLYRRIEHTLQMMHEGQTHLMPADPDERAKLALRCGFAKPEKFERTLREMRDFVRERFSDLFGNVGGREPSLADLICDPLGEPTAAAIRELSRFGLGSRDAFFLLRELAVGSREHSPSARASRDFRRLLPGVLEEARLAAIPAAAVQNFDRLLRAARGYSWVYDLCLSHPPILRLLMRSLGCGSRLGRGIIAHPEWLDELFNADGLKETRLESAKRRLEGASREDVNSLVRWKEMEAFLVGVKEVLAIMDYREAAAHTTLIAEIVLRRASGMLGNPPMRPLAIIALGSFGTRFVHVCGDLDLAFIIDDSEPLGDEEFARAAGWCQRLVALMTSTTPDGMLWRIDARLRPEGKNSPLLVTASRARRYYRQDADLWEWQALTKARCVVGDADFGAAILTELQSAYQEKPHPDIGPRVLGMKRRIEANLRLPAGTMLHLKHSPGGVEDVEFLIQALRLTTGDAALFFADEAVVLEAAVARGVLSATDRDFVLRHAGMLRMTQRMHRLLRETDSDALPSDPERQAELSRALSDQSLLTGIDFLECIEAECRRMRGVFESTLEKIA